ncbi:uncharacterized protein APUU_11674A [Aspergillus puulaauensis]|uniref:Uncharacterized protein n=1 Tax=Aspergillus puulaauensis TaxID=1220207 RepID=A0A7R7XCP8_9EURO|nr:uncharacterized protein APUU_11674A [Aspergillus puulaauensis]BCS18846.1 hypothetical protein APUU_11674A [Aspergillus puulaauensis]
MRGYTCLDTKSPRSFLFAVVANVGPQGTSRSLTVAYRQGCDSSTSPTARVEQVVADTLALIEVLSDPANRAPLEAERALAEVWYRRQSLSQQGDEVKSSERPIVPGTPQPPFVVPDGRHRGQQVESRPELPWRDDAPCEFPFTATCCLLGLLKNDSTRPGDVQLQSLSTIFRGDCAEYGLVVLDISDLDAVKYGIVAFPVRYMAEVSYRGEDFGWDPVEDRPPEKEPDIVPISPRPRKPLSVIQWLRRYLTHISFEKDPSVLRLDDKPVVGDAALDYIWPPEREETGEDQDKASSQGILSSISDYLWPSKPTTSVEDTSNSLTTSNEAPQMHIDRAIDGLLTLTQDPTDIDLDGSTFSNFQKLAEFRDQLRRRLEEIPDSLGSSKVSGYILRIIYAKYKHHNWVIFRNLSPRVIATAIISNELQDASALSLGVDNFDLNNGGLGDLAASLTKAPALKQVCILQRPDRDSDTASARFFTQLLQGRSGDLGWLRDKSIYSTWAFSAGLHSRTSTSSSTDSADFSSVIAQVFPAVHMFTFVDQLPQYQSSYKYYDMSNTLLDAESFSVRFLSYLRSLGSGSDKAILQFAYGSSSLTTDDDKAGLHVSPIPAGFFGSDPPRAIVRVRDLHPGSWIVLVEQDSSSNSENVFQYSFVRIRPVSAGITPGRQERPHIDDIEVVGVIMEFLRETVPGSDMSTHETESGSRVMAESSARELLEQLL